MGLKMKRDVRAEREGSEDRLKGLFPLGVPCLVEQDKSLCIKKGRDESGAWGHWEETRAIERPGGIKAK